MIILLDEHGHEIGTLDQESAPASVLVDGNEFVFEGMDGDDRVYRRREWGS